MLIDKLRELLKTPSHYGPDLDLGRYELGVPSISESLEVNVSAKEASSRVGIGDVSKVSYVQVDEVAMYKALEDALGRYGVKVMPLRRALSELPNVRELVWRLVRPDLDKYTAASYLYGGELGYFIYVPPKTEVPIPIYACLTITKDRKAQFAHNVVYVDEYSVAHIVTGCAVPHGIKDGLHVGISEFYVGRGAKLTFSMIHAWSEGLHVRPRTAVSVAEGGEYLSYYVVYSPVASIQTYPSVSLATNGKAYLTSIVAGSGHGIYDIGSKVVLSGQGSSAEIVSRVVASGHSKVYARSEIVADDVSKGHVECLGLLLSENSEIHSIPVITSRKPGALLSHEAAIGIIAEEELEYLMSRGFNENEAKSIIVRGFINVEIRGLPLTIVMEIDRLLDVISKHATG